MKEREERKAGRAEHSEEIREEKDLQGGFVVSSVVSVRYVFSPTEGAESSEER